MYEVKWAPKTAAELEELCNKAVEHGFELVACNDEFCVFKSAQHRVQADLPVCICSTRPTPTTLSIDPNCTVHGSASR